MNRRKTAFSVDVDFWTRWGLAGLIVCLALGAMYWHSERVRISDPDRYYHLELARRTAIDGPFSHLPEVDNLLPQDQYANGYWLFTYLGSLAYKIGGEQGVLNFGFLCAASILLILLWFAHRYLTIGVSLLVMVGIFFSPDAMNRLFLFRPHLLSMLLILLLVQGVLARNFYLTFAAGFLQVWSYQAPFIPLLVCLAAIVFSRSGGKPWAMASLSGIAGVAAGILTHPHFPNYLRPMWTTFQYSAPSVLVPQMFMPIEHTGVSLLRLLGGLFFFSLPLFLMTARIFPQTRKVFFKGAKSPSTDYVFIALCLAGFWALSCITARALEYVYPLAFLAWVLVLKERKEGLSQVAPVWIALVFTFPIAWNSYFIERPIDLSPENVLEALHTLPENPAGKKILNVSWSQGAMILYGRPGYRFVDFGDPRALATYRPDLFTLRKQMLENQLVDPFGVIKFAFDADYVLVPASPIQRLLDQSPHFRKISDVTMAANPADHIYVYETGPRRSPFQVKKFEMQQESPRSVSSEKTWSVMATNSSLPEEQRSTFLNLSGGEGCRRVRPILSEQKYLYGSQVLSLGGAGDLKVYWNGKNLFRGRLGKRQAVENEIFVPLPHVLTARDQIVLEICSEKASAPEGLFVSLYSGKYLQALCDWKGIAKTGTAADLGWMYSNAMATTCLGPIAHSGSRKVEGAMTLPNFAAEESVPK